MVERTHLGLRRLGYLDGLRGLAAVYVVVSHAWDTVFPLGRRTPGSAAMATAWLGFGRYAVSLFIVISGFSLGLVAWRNDLTWPGGFRTFIHRRVRRIWPPYVVALSVCVALATTVLTPAGSSRFFAAADHVRLGGVVIHALLLQDMVWGGPVGNNAFWSIAVEFHIYFFFGLALVLLRHRRSAWKPLVVGLFLLTFACSVAADQPAMGHVARLFPGLYALFLLGFAASRFAVPNVGTDARSWEQTLWWLFALALVLEVADRAHFDPLGPVNDLWLGPLVALGVSRMARGRLVRMSRLLEVRPMRWLGSSSYSLYLIHAPILEAVWRLVVKPGGLSLVPALVVEVTVGVIASVAASRVLFWAVEKRFLAPRRPTETAAPSDGLRRPLLSDPGRVSCGANRRSPG